MNSWQRNRNYRKTKNSDGSYTYIITASGEDVEVNSELYKEYATAARKMEYTEQDLKCDRVLKDARGRTVFDDKGFPIVLPEREVSMNKLMAENWNYPTSEPSAEEIVIMQFEIKALYGSLELLEEDERALITALYFRGKSERQYSSETGIAQKTISNRRHRILGKLKKYLENL